MISKFMLGFATVALAIGSAATYNVTLPQPAVLNGHELKPGAYKLDLKNNTLVFHKGKETVETAVKVESGSGKFPGTAVSYATNDGKLNVKEIRLGGTNIKLVVDNTTVASGL